MTIEQGRATEHVAPDPSGAVCNTVAAAGVTMARVPLIWQTGFANYEYPLPLDSKDIQR